MIFETILSLFGNYGYLLALLGGFFGGEETITVLTFLAVAGKIKLWDVIIFGFIGMFLCDHMFFFIGRLRLMKKLFKFRKFTNHYHKLDRLIRKASMESVFLTVLYTKFIYGISIITLVYLGFKGTKLRTFTISSFIANIIGMTIIVTLAYFFGGMFFLFLKTFRNLQLSIFLIIVLFVLFLILKKWISERFLKPKVE
ncbi:hypothetical protein HOD75_00825 [archaeon]|nr:hypothetical protein [archaeon]MBT4241420.1 hypothetical protein [archaeon]MBT4417709.1 hypothetical protein [archaeon]